MTAFAPSARVEVPYVELDPVTQTSRYFAPSGQPIEAGRHGTDKETNKNTTTSGSDSARPAKDHDNTIDYADDC
ncbi:putative ATP-grasp-modified RiPP [Nonomuraea sp. NPDC048916]|uniref:putative ATP-grasp-modified RiPP n=1 Tax=Nonomuraea sp. NPDC048916 TaxID=3154232 RepID=UPI0033E66BA1